jgi:predicted metal-dependent phosphoesterase TrpH
MKKNRLLFRRRRPCHFFPPFSFGSRDDTKTSLAPAACRRRRSREQNDVVFAPHRAFFLRARVAADRAAAAGRSSPRAAANAAGNSNSRPSLRARVARLFSREVAGLSVGAWAAVAAAAVAVALAAWNEQRLQERAREAEKEALTSSSEDWRHAKWEAKEAAKDARSAASKLSKGQ